MNNGSAIEHTNVTESYTTGLECNETQMEWTANVAKSKCNGIAMERECKQKWHCTQMKLELFMTTTVIGMGIVSHYIST